MMKDMRAAPNSKVGKRRRMRMVIPAYAAFNIYSFIARTTTALGPLCVASAVREMGGWDIEIIDENNYRKLAPRDGAGLPDHQALQKLRPADVVGFYGGLTSTIPRLYELARFYQKQGVLTIGGGQHFIAENILEALQNGVDVVVLGEGEETIKDLLSAFDGKCRRNEIAGIAYLEKDQLMKTPERMPLTDFDQLPIPDFSLVRYAKLKLYPVGRVRGCGMDCEFCTVKGKARYASPERLMEQIAILFETRGAKKFFIVDDLFAQDRMETLRLCGLLRKYQERMKTRFKISIQIRLDKGKDAELLQNMHEAGITNIAVGFESPIREELKAMDKRLKPEEMISLSRAYYKAGFFIHAMFIFGYPIADGIDFKMGAKDRIRRFRRFIKQARVDSVQVMLPVPLPGTELTQRLTQQNRIYPKKYLGWEYYDGNFPLFVPDDPMTPEEMQTSIHVIMGRFYRFKHMFHIGLNILSFPVLFFYLHNLKKGWRIWFRKWYDNTTRFGGWLIMRRWFSEFKKNNYSTKLAEAKQILARSLPELAKTLPSKSFPTSAG